MSLTIEVFDDGFRQGTFIFNDQYFHLPQIKPQIKPQMTQMDTNKKQDYFELH